MLLLLLIEDDDFRSGNGLRTDGDSGYAGQCAGRFHTGNVRSLNSCCHVIIQVLSGIIPL